MNDLENTLVFGTGASAAKNYEDLLKLIQKCIESNILIFDTAPSYKTEKILGKVLSECIQKLKIQREKIVIQTKIDPWQMQDNRNNVRYYVEDALKKMNFSYLDTLFIHWPIPEYLDRTWKSFIDIHEEGLVKNIGICNIRYRHLLKFKNLNMMPQIIQIERHPLNICKKEIDFCLDNNIKIQAYSPLCKMSPLLKNSKILKNIACKYNKSIGQIILRWHVDTGVQPVFTSKKINRIEEYSNIFDFNLTKNEIMEINKMNKNYKLYLESCICPGL